MRESPPYLKYSMLEVTVFELRLEFFELEVTVFELGLEFFELEVKMV